MKRVVVKLNNQDLQEVILDTNSVDRSELLDLSNQYFTTIHRDNSSKPPVAVEILNIQQYIDPMPQHHFHDDDDYFEDDHDDYFYHDDENYF